LILSAPTFEADTPILNGLVSSGRLEIIRNEEVLALISEWDRTFYDYTTFAERARGSVDERLIPAFVVRGDIGSVLMGTLAQPGQLDSIPVSIDDELKGLVAERWRNGRNALNRFTDARSVAGELVAKLESDLRLRGRASVHSLCRVCC
jgi:hypothetical protein